MASCRQCQTSALFLGGDLSALCLNSLLLRCRRGGATGIRLALAFRQRRSSIFVTVSGLVDGVSAGVGFAAGTIIPGSARALGSSSLSDFADSFSTNAGSILLLSCAGSTTKKAGGAATLIAIANPKPTKQKTATHIVLDNHKAPTEGGKDGS
jgi:hypothetical protein